MEVDHFVPEDEIKDPKYGGKFNSLFTDYDNLVYLCKKCNLAKSNQRDCDLNVNQYDNKFFYNPVLTNYNNIFFRNRYGSIQSLDNKGQDSIIRLKLYRRIHNLAWLLEQMDNLSTEFEAKHIHEIDAERKKDYMEIKDIATKYYKMFYELLNISYKSC